MRKVLVLLGLLVLGGATAVYAASIPSANVRPLGSGSASVSRCQVRSYTIAATGAISSISATVRCTAGGSYIVSATFTSGTSSGSGSVTTTLSANTNTSISIPISPSVTISGSAYNVVFTFKKA